MGVVPPLKGSQGKSGMSEDLRHRDDRPLYRSHSFFRTVLSVLITPYPPDFLSLDDLLLSRVFRSFRSQLRYLSSL